MLPLLFTNKSNGKKIIALELIATTGIQTISHSFYQVTNAQKRVVGRSKVVLVDSSKETEAVIAWPAIRISWDDYLSSPTIAATGTNTPLMEQPILISIYGFKGDGKHVLFGSVSTSLQDLVDKANQLGTSHTLKGLREKKSSYTLSVSHLQNQHHHQRQQEHETCINLFVKQIKSTDGTSDTISQEYFQPQRKDVARLPSLCLITTPPGLPAQHEKNIQYT
eukprot:scaffold2769_cov156-Amphora_coffeaeformis.AAC.8